MAIVKLVYGLEIEGSLGGDVWRRDQCRFHVQSKTSKKRKHFFTQNFCFEYIANSFKYHNWTTDELAAWSAYALTHKLYSKKGVLYANPVYHAFLSFNIERCLHGKYLVFTPEDENFLNFRCQVSGQSVPDVNGIYTPNGTFNSHTKWERSDSLAWILFADVGTRWHIKTYIPEMIPVRFVASHRSLIGYYVAVTQPGSMGNAEGYAYVMMIPPA